MIELSSQEMCDFTNANMERVEELERRIAELEADAAVHDEQLTKVARIRLDLEVENERLRDAIEGLRCQHPRCKDGQITTGPCQDGLTYIEPCPTCRTLEALAAAKENDE